LPAAGLPAWRVEVFARRPEHDVAAGHAREELAAAGLAGVRQVRSGRGYLLCGALERGTVERIAAELLFDPVLEEARLIAPNERSSPTPAAARRLFVRRKRGVMDPVALSVERALSRSLLAKAPPDQARCATLHVYEVQVDAPAQALATAALRALANDVVDDVFVDPSQLFLAGPAQAAPRSPQAVPIRALDAAGLARLSRDGQLSLSALEMEAIQGHYRALGREPSACELETLAQTWSEHCKHKTFTGRIDFEGERIDNLLKQTIKRATLELEKSWCVSVFHDNAGIVEFLAPQERGAGAVGWNVCFKVETHNHPSAIDPFGGAGTGVGGVIRDILGVGLGAKPIANTDAFFVGPLDLPQERLPKGVLHPARVLRGVVAGVRDYGNPMGIPTVNGGLWVHPRYLGNPLVFAGTVGLLPADCSHKSVRPGDRIVVVGGRTGRDGIHGATFSSIELGEESGMVSNSAVQIGDPITEKRLQDGLLAARERRLYRAVTDCGAGGLSSAVGEMGAECGAEVHLERVPLKYAGLASHEIWISEAQERMVLAVPPECLDELLATFAAEDVEATDIGTFTGSGKLVLFDGGAQVGELDMRFLHEGTPRPLRRAVRRARPADEPEDAAVPACADPRAMLLAMLGSGDACSREWIVRQYDHEVQGMSVQKALVGVRGDGPGDAAVLQPLWDSQRGLAIACGAQPRYGLLDPWAMAAASIDEALRNAVAVGADPARIAILDNFSWGSCEKPENLGDLVLAARACYATAKAFGTPFISGKDSLNNEFKTAQGTLSIPPTLYVSALGIVPDVARSVSMDLKRAGNALYLVGLTHAELGGSLYFDLGGHRGGRVPRPDLALAPRHLAALHRAIGLGLVASCHDLSEGGLALAAAEMAFAGGLGAAIDLEAVPLGALEPGQDPGSVRLFSESCTRFLLEVEAGHAAALEREFAGLDLSRVGEVRSRAVLSIASKSQAAFEVPLEELRAAHHSGFGGGSGS
jgi:phosphoribosylformylglycinamidine synthase